MFDILTFIGSIILVLVGVIIGLILVAFVRQAAINQKKKIEEDKLKRDNDNKIQKQKNR